MREVDLGDGVVHGLFTIEQVKCDGIHADRQTERQFQGCGHGQDYGFWLGIEDISMGKGEI